MFDDDNVFDLSIRSLRETSCILSACCSACCYLQNPKTSGCTQYFLLGSPMSFYKIGVDGHYALTLFAYFHPPLWHFSQKCHIKLALFSLYLSLSLLFSSPYSLSLTFFFYFLSTPSIKTDHGQLSLLFWRGPSRVELVIN